MNRKTVMSRKTAMNGKAVVNGKTVVIGNESLSGKTAVSERVVMNEKAAMSEQTAMSRSHQTIKNSSNKKTNKEVVWLQLTAGQGPKECGWVVAQLQRKVIREAKTFSLKVELVESLAFEKNLRKQDLIEPDEFLSVLLRIEGEGASCFSKRWQGAIKWHGESPYRPKHKRINWFVGVESVELVNAQKVDMNKLQNEVRVESMRSSGPGGQHVNKTNSAVRVLHLPTGIRIRVDTDRSQHRNRQLAMERLSLILAAGFEKDEKESERLRWLNHYQVKRGNPTRTFVGSNFTER